MRRAYLAIGRDALHKHPDDFDDTDWQHAREYLALRWIENEEQEAAMNG